jgi:hypothetical protein
MTTAIVLIGLTVVGFVVAVIDTGFVWENNFAPRRQKLSSVLM